MPREHHYWVYIMASWSRVLYIGVTSDIEGRLYEHRTEDPRSFTSRYRVHRLVYIEEYTWVDDAIAREKQLKTWRRSKKVALIESENPEWIDLSKEW
jgi:putative endonuclease